MDVSRHGCLKTFRSVITEARNYKTGAAEASQIGQAIKTPLTCLHKNITKVKFQENSDILSYKSDCSEAMLLKFSKHPNLAS